MIEITAAVNEYLDSMPPLSRIVYPDLVTVIMSRIDGVNKGYRPDLVRQIATGIVRNRKDFMVMRQKGICKWNRP